MKYFLVPLCSLAFCLSTASFARDPIHVESVLNSARLQGSGRLTWWGFDVYDAALYRAGNLNSPEFALDLRYQKSFSGISIANRTTEEMKRLGVSDTQATLWGRELATFLPNVESGQTLTAMYNPKQGTLFYYDGKQIAQIKGADFSKAFFGIWFDSKTSAPKLRSELLGQYCPPPLIGEGC
ncbi:MAG: chalcone isomerase family protein [Polynucleobacter sp.]